MHLAKVTILPSFFQSKTKLNGISMHPSKKSTKELPVEELEVLDLDELVVVFALLNSAKTGSYEYFGSTVDGRLSFSILSVWARMVSC